VAGQGVDAVAVLAAGGDGVGAGAHALAVDADVAAGAAAVALAAQLHGDGARHLGHVAEGAENLVEVAVVGADHQVALVGVGVAAFGQQRADHRQHRFGVGALDHMDRHLVGAGGAGQRQQHQQGQSKTSGPGAAG
jgi:hypothetical protein